MKQRGFIFAVEALAAALTALQGSAATIVVTNTSASGVGSLQQAILDANAMAGLDTITFELPGAGMHTIAPTNALPAITDSVVIDGTTQPGFVGTPLIEVNGINAGDTTDGFRLSAGSSTIRGLMINRFGGAGIHIQAPGGTNSIQGNFIGTDPTGAPNLGNGRANTKSGGVWVEGSPGNRIGGPYLMDGNLISGNGGSGVYLQNCSGNAIQGNLIGTTVSGTTALGNSTNGVSLYNAAGNQIGGSSAAARNVISGNGWSGVAMSGTGSMGNHVEGNYIGTDANGTAALPNASNGIALNGAPGNVIGGSSAGTGNLVSGNGQGGIIITGPGADTNQIQGNLIGSDVTGRLALGNTFSGITILNANSNLIGGTTSAARNIISANRLSGLFLTNSTGNVIQGNFIGVDATGGAALGNAATGISLNGAGSNSIGGTTAGARNIISGNTSHGIEVFSPGATGNWIAGNYIGADVTGASSIPNGDSGVHIQSSGNTIGGTATGAGNVISGNTDQGVFLDGASAAGNVVQGNLIGTTASGTGALKNRWGGVGISWAPGNTIGGTTAGAGNVISANADVSGDAGVFLIGNGATGNVIQGNKIGTDITGTLPLGNTHEGIYLENAPSNSMGGAIPAAANLISANNTRGIFLVNAPWNVIQGNLIGTKSDGVSGLGNKFHSVECEAGACNNTIGGDGRAGNTIAYAQSIYAGVRIRDGSTNNAILGNSIFSNGALGIDLGSVNPNPNVSCGNGSGANMAQSYPVLAQAVSGNGTGIRGTLNSRPNAAFMLQFFANAACDGSGYGEGQIYLGQKTVVTGPYCTNSFVATLPGQVPLGHSITATATDSGNNTSEFSACVPVAAVPALAISSVPASQQVKLAWTNTTSGFVLKQTTSLSPVIEWTAVTNTPVNTNGQFVVTLPATTGNRFYVLCFE